MEPTEPKISEDMSLEELLVQIKQKVEDLELLDNSYFQKDRAAKMREMHDEIIALLDTKKFDLENVSKNQKSKNEIYYYYYYKGKTLDFIPEFQKEAEELL